MSSLSQSWFHPEVNGALVVFETGHKGHLALTRSAVVVMGVNGKVLVHFTK